MSLTPAQKLLIAPLHAGTARKAELPTVIDRKEKVVAVNWDYAVHGGANAADINLGYTFEEAVIVTKVLFHELTDVVGATSTYTLEAGATALTEDVAVASIAGITQPALAGSAAGIAVASGSALQLNIGTANATAGKVRFYVYMVPQRDN
jgi:hypothetical protein